MFTAPYVVRFPKTDKAGDGRALSDDKARDGWQREEEPGNTDTIVETKVRRLQRDGDGHTRTSSSYLTRMHAHHLSVPTWLD